MIRLVLALCGAACLAGCNTTVPPNVTFGGPGLISGQTPPSPLALNSEPEPPNSLPPGAQGMGHGPTARVPDIGSATIRLPQ